MRRSKINDYRVHEETRLDGRKVWKITVGGDYNVTTCRTLQEATKAAKNLNLDPWYLDRNQTPSSRRTGITQSI